MPELPPPLPPGERTVGQLIAETIRLYGDHFWRALPLGLPIAVLDQLDLGRGGGVRDRALPRVRAVPRARVRLRLRARRQGSSPGARTLAVATAIGTVVLLPASLVFTWFALIAAVYLRSSAWPCRSRCSKEPARGSRCGGRCELGRADYVHALGSLAALVIVFFLSRQVLVSLLHGQADETIRVAVFLADLVLAPLMLLGTAMLYFDQAARVGVDRKQAVGRRPTPR